MSSSTAQGRATFVMPADRAIVSQTRPSLCATSLSLPLRHLGGAGLDSLERVGFAALFAASRLTGQADLSARLAADRFLSASFDPDATLAQALSSLRATPSPSPLHVPAGLHLLASGANANPDETSLSLEIAGAAATLRLHHDPAQVSALSAADFLEKIALVLDALERAPQTRCYDLALVSATARTLIPDLTRPITARHYPSVATTFFAVASRQPGAPAIANHAASYSYGDLARTASHLAAGLRSQGLKAGEVVAVHGVSSFGMLAAMLGVLASGGVLVTIDQTLPEERRSLIARISEPRLHIHVASDPGEPAPAAGALVTPAWPERPALDTLPAAAPPAVEVAPDATAYIFFTSGSSGVPKGVLGTHLGLAHFLDWQRGAFPIGPGDRTAQLTALSFDVVLRDVLFPLTSGACVHIPRRELLFDARRMLAWIQQTGITSMHCVPSLMKAWLQAHREGRPFQSLSYIFFAGEPLIDGLLTRFRASASPDTRIVNLYGPTETTLAKLANPIETIEPGVQPVGRPQPGVDVVILRDRRTPCGLWEIGEIAIRTPYRSQGYYRNPALTREVFLPNPWRDDADDLIYMTGDLGRYRPDGKIEIFGRVDAQIKIRGVRIEPNEIENQMLKLPGVRDAAVTLRAGADDDKQLIGLVVMNEAASAAPSPELGQQLRETLRQTLQEAMVPSRIVVKDSLPYLPNGKLDRKAIGAMDLALEPAASLSQATSAHGHLEPRMRELLTGIEKVLGQRIDRLERSFIDMGGNSLSYIRVSMLIEDTLGYLPTGWERAPLGDLVRLGAEAKVTATRNSQPTSSLEVTLLFRALAIIMVVLSHTESMSYLMATSTLFVISGMNFSRFLRPALQAAGDIKPTLKLVLAFGIPAGLWQALRSVPAQDVWLPDLFLMGTFFQNPARPHFTLWFLDVLAANLLLLALIGWVGHRLRRWREDAGTSQATTSTPASQFSKDFLWLLIGVAAALAQVSTGWANGAVGADNVAPFKWFWLLALGVLIAGADTNRRKMLVTAVLLVVAAAKGSHLPLLESLFNEEQTFFFVSVLICLWVDRVAIPKALQKPLVVIASSTLFIYIVNYAVVYHIMPKLHVPPWWPYQLAGALVAGITAKWAWDRGGSGLQSLLRAGTAGIRRGSRSSALHPPGPSSRPSSPSR